MTFDPKLIFFYLNRYGVNLLLQWLQKYVIAKAGETRGSRTALLVNWCHMGYLFCKSCVLVRRCLQTVIPKPKEDDYFLMVTFDQFNKIGSRFFRFPSKCIIAPTTWLHASQILSWNWLKFLAILNYLLLPHGCAWCYLFEFSEWISPWNCLRYIFINRCCKFLACWICMPLNCVTILYNCYSCLVRF